MSSALAVLAVFAGAGLGALLRWGFVAWLNPMFEIGRASCRERVYSSV